MSDRDALLAAILANPDEDTPRLVYADWLQENGEEDRAAFIRVQCRLEHVSVLTAEGKRLRKFEKELRARLFGHFDAPGSASVSFRRGFVSRITSGLLTFRDHLAVLGPEDAPAYEWVYRPDDRDEREFESSRLDPYDAQTDATTEVFVRPELRRCVSLDLPCTGMLPGAVICESEQLVNLRRLNFPGNETGPGIESVASCRFANLRWANFRYSNSAGGRPSITPFAECPDLTNLEYLDFGENVQGDGDLKALASSSYLPRLRHLNVSVSLFGDGIGDLFNTKHLESLAELDLSESFGSFGETEPRDADRYAVLIADSSLFARLSKLWLQRNSITDEGAKALAAYPREVKLELLDLSRNPITEVGKRALRKRFGKDVCVFEAPHRD